MNKYKDPKLMAQRIAEIKATRRIGPVMPALPLPDEDGFAVHVTRLDDVSVMAKFEQSPPPHSVPVPQPIECWNGSLLFMDPQGELWVVPSVWYNEPWSERLVMLREALERTKQLQLRAADELRRLQTNPQGTRQWRADCRELKYQLSHLFDQRQRLEARIRHYEANVPDKSQCPHLAPVDD